MIGCGGESGGFPGGDEDEGATCLEETNWEGERGLVGWAWYRARNRGGNRARKIERREENTHAEAACNPNPLEPPVITATFPLSENRFAKSGRWVS